MLVSVVVPVYDNAGSIPSLVDRLTRVADELPEAGFEFVFVDDGSADGSYDLLVRHADSDSRIRAIKLSRNFGSNAAILAGLTHARGDCTVVIAADLQDPPELIPEMLQAWRTGVDVVLAARQEREDPLLSRLLAGAFNRLFRMLVFPDFPKEGFDFMLISRRVGRLLVKMGERNSHLFGQVMWVGFRRRIIYYQRVQREVGSSGWTTMKKVKYFIDAFTAFSYLPIRVASLLGFILAFAGFGYGLLLTALKLAGAVPVAGFSSLMVVVLIASGSQLLVIGMIGEYLWRVLEESRLRPVFIVESMHGDAPVETEADRSCICGLDSARSPIPVASTGGSPQVDVALPSTKSR